MLLFEEKITDNHDAFVQKVYDIANTLQINPNWLMAYMNSETAGTFSPSIQNKKTLATGLAQIMPATALYLGTTVDDLKLMTNVEQLDWVLKYFYPYRNYINSYEDLYLVGFYPNADGKFAGTLSKPDDWKFPAIVTAQNPGIDTIASFRNFIWRNIPADEARAINTNPGLMVTAEKFVIRNAIPITIISGLFIGFGIFIIVTSKTKK